MAFHDPVYVELFDKDDQIITPVMVPISITQNWESHDFNYIAVQVETYDSVMRKVLERWANKELIQYRLTSRAGVDTGDLNSVYAYDAGGSGEFSFYGRSHKELMKTVIGFPDPSTNTVETAQNHPNRGRQYATGYKDYQGKAGKVMEAVLRDNVVNRLKMPMRFEGTNVGNDVKIRFRFDEIHQHFYANTKEKGGALLEENGNVIFDITRDFDRREFVMTAREPERHQQMLTPGGGMIERWHFTSERPEADRVIVGGPREAKERLEASVSRTPEHRRFPAEVFVEHTSPDLEEDDKAPHTDPTDADLQKEARAALVKMVEYAEDKLRENGSKGLVYGELIETEQLYLGGTLKLGDWVRIGIDEDLLLSEQQLEKAITTWTREDGYKTMLTKPDDQETTEITILKKLMDAVRELATRDRRK